MQIEFQRKIRGTDSQLSISIPARFINTYILEPGQYVNVWFQDTDLKPTFQSRKFASRISKCGLVGRIIYIPKQFAEDYKLSAGQEFYWKVEVL